MRAHQGLPLKAITRRIASPRKTEPTPWKPAFGLSGPTRLLMTFDP
jgi:hypothetical protein